VKFLLDECQVTDDLNAGALVVISDTRVRTRLLPVKPVD
jgi:hypothetical protein